MRNVCLQSSSEYSKITKRERDILRYIAAGLKNMEIADKLNLSVRTVEWHRSNLIYKLKFENASQLVIFAVESAKGKQG